MRQAAPACNPPPMQTPTFSSPAASRFECLDDWHSLLRALAPPWALTWGWSACAPWRSAWPWRLPARDDRGRHQRAPPAPKLEAVALQAGHRTGVYTSPHLVHSKSAAVSTARSWRPKPAGAFSKPWSARAAQRPVSLSYFEFTTLAILRLMSSSRPGRGHLGSGPGRAAGCHQPDRCRLRRHHGEHRRGSTPVFGADRESDGRERPASCARGAPSSSTDRCHHWSGGSCAGHGVQTCGWRSHDFQCAGDKQRGGPGRTGRRRRAATTRLRGANQVVNTSRARWPPGDLA